MTNALDTTNLLSLKEISEEEDTVPPKLQCVSSDLWALSPTDVGFMSSIPPVSIQVDPKGPPPPKKISQYPLSRAKV
ncbi:hypothetical protein XELAEV_18000299mg [Xenopus laevis]|uniref:Uncharacterized protein n=1 Tax=Xenopus laevis TaxID=8355 RepID=A0A974BPA2_XENLA|nr:hypothetical protein XELAEV_18000299mg [Xenopus laevis]